MAARAPNRRRGAGAHVATTAFLALFAIVGIALYGLPFFYDFFVQGLRLDAAAGHVGQRLQQADRRAGVRILRRMVRRSIRSAAADAGWHSDGRRSARGPRQASDADRCSTSSTCSMRSATCCGGRCRTRCCCRAGSTRPRQGDGLRLPGDRHRRSDRAAARVPADQRVRLARRAAGPRRPDGRRRVSVGVVRAGNGRDDRTRRRLCGAPRRWPRSGRCCDVLRSTCCSSAACARSARSAATIQNLKLYLSLDRGSRQAHDRAGPLARARQQPDRARADGIPGRPLVAGSG